MTEKKNQHYIPKFYLRNFSYEANRKQIGIYNIHREYFFQQAKLKTQGSRNFFYGYDGLIENTLADIEGDLATIIKQVITGKTLPEKGTNEHFELIQFVALTDLRNPVRIESMKQMFGEMRRRLLELDPNTDVNKFVPALTHDELIRQCIPGSMDVALTMLDLDVKLLLNHSTKPFIASDFPVVKYNQFLEQRKWPHSKTGYGATGLQVFVPLNPEVALLFYDSGIYKVGQHNQTFHALTHEKDIQAMNTLQFLNCLETIYFNENADEAYLRKLHEGAKPFGRANRIRSELGYLVKENDERNKRTIEAGFKNFLTINNTDCEMELQLDGINIHDKGQSHVLNDSLAQLRPYVAKLRR